MRLLWRIALWFLGCTVLSLTLASWYAYRSLRTFHRQQVAAELLTRAQLCARELEALSGDTERTEVARRCRELGRLTQTRVTVVLPDGAVVGDSDRDPELMENHCDHPEIAAALQGTTGRVVRFGDTLRSASMYVAIPVCRDGKIAAVVRTAMPLGRMDWAPRSVYQQIALGVVMAALLAVPVAFYLARRVSTPLEEMRRIAERLAGGDLTARAFPSRSPEMASLARTLNQMAAELQARIETVARQRDFQEAVLASMLEGVLAVDGEGRVLDMNASCARLLELTPEEARGRSIQEVCRNPGMQEFIAMTLAGAGPMERDIVIYGRGESFLQLHGTTLRDAAGRHCGAVVVISDITRIKRLETIRRDFVANVSHELKTPLTALKGCVETLLERGRRTPQDEETFIAMMARQVERLGAIVDDLLMLARIEHDAELGRVAWEPARIADVLRLSVRGLAPAAAAKSIRVEVHCPEALEVRANAAWLEQAVGNLLDNAIKYSPDSTEVVVRALARGQELEISVSDQGPGIDRKHLPRLFERFYRVDQARSRALGGTGLGLAIVKHIALAHGGSVSVESVPGQGSTFFLRIPLA